MKYNPQRNEHGQVVRWYAAGTDIDERKQADERVRNEVVALREEIDRASMFDEIVGSSAPLRRVLAQIAKIAATDSTVLILGETGTGKELIARAIHRRSKLWMAAMLGWLSDARTSASRWKRLTRSASRKNSSGRILMATSRFSFKSRAR